MIELNTGRPGAGKTYRVVHRLLQNEVATKYSIFHNIEGLKSSLIGDAGSHCHYWPDIPDFLTFSKQEEIAKYERETHDRPMLVIIDEAQNWFADRNGELKRWLSYHRHLGQDVWLICQHYKMIHSDYYNLCEYEVRGKKGVMLGMMVYQYMVGGERWKTEKLKTSKVTFAAYKSFDQEGAKKKGSLLIYYAGAVAVLCLVLIVYLVSRGIPSAFAKLDESQPGKSSSKKNRKAGAEPIHPVAAGIAASTTPSPFKTLSYAGVLGDRVLIQDTSKGGLSFLDEQEGFEEVFIVERSSRWVRVITPDGKISKLTAKRINVGELSRPPSGQARPNEKGSSL